MTPERAKQLAVLALRDKIVVNKRQLAKMRKYLPANAGPDNFEVAAYAELQCIVAEQTAAANLLGKGNTILLYPKESA